MSFRRDSGVQSIDRAVAILKAFSQDEPELGVTDLSRRLSLHKSTVFRILSALETGGLVAKNKANGRYHLGVGLIGLAQVATHHSDLRSVARPFLDKLGHITQETVSLAILDKYRVITLDQVVPHQHQVVAFPGVGHSIPGYCAAAGKVLLAYISLEAVERLLNAIDKHATAMLKPINRKEFLAELEQVRSQGFALSLEELEPGLNALAAPICNHFSEVVAALSVAGPIYRLASEQLYQLAPLICQMADQISARLGCAPSTGPNRAIV
ncbi:MAG: IclR family transcriptional regulator [Anaerolineae bacterium]